MGCVLINIHVSSFQRKVEMFHETQAEFGDRGDGYVSRTIALVNCCPPLRYMQSSGKMGNNNILSSGLGLGSTQIGRIGCIEPPEMFCVRF